MDTSRGEAGDRGSLSSWHNDNGIPRVEAGTWGIFSGYGGDGHSKLVFVQRRQDSCLVSMDTSGI